MLNCLICEVNCENNFFIITLYRSYSQTDGMFYDFVSTVKPTACFMTLSRSFKSVIYIINRSYSVLIAEDRTLVVAVGAKIKLTTLTALVSIIIFFLFNLGNNYTIKIAA